MTVIKVDFPKLRGFDHFLERWDTQGLTQAEACGLLGLLPELVRESLHPQVVDFLVGVVDSGHRQGALGQATLKALEGMMDDRWYREPKKDDRSAVERLRKILSNPSIWLVPLPEELSMKIGQLLVSHAVALDHLKQKRQERNRDVHQIFLARDLGQALVNLRQYEPILHLELVEVSGYLEEAVTERGMVSLAYALKHSDWSDHPWFRGAPILQKLRSLEAYTKEE